MKAFRRELLIGVPRLVGGACFRPPVACDCVGVLARLVGVFARLVGVLSARDVLPFELVPGRLGFDGEFDRVDSGLVEPVGLASFRTDNGRREDGVNVVLSDKVSAMGRVGAPFRATGGLGFDPAVSLWARRWVFVGDDVPS